MILTVTLSILKTLSIAEEPFVVLFRLRTKLSGGPSGVFFHVKKRIVKSKVLFKDVI